MAVGSQVLMFDVQGGNLVAQWELGAEIWSPVTVTADVALVGAGGRVVVIDRVSGRQTVVDLPLAEPPVETVVVYSDSWIAVSDERGLRAWQSAM